MSDDHLMMVFAMLSAFLAGFILSGFVYIYTTCP